MISRANLLNFANFEGQAANRVLPPVVSLLLVVLIAWQLATLFWTLMPGKADGISLPRPTESPQATAATDTMSDVAAIASAHMFGIADAQPVEAQPIAAPDDDLADTRLVNLVLNGTVASEIENYSVAIISDGGNDQQVYTIGDAVGSNAKLHAVYADRVVLNEKGTLTNLKLPTEFKNAPVTSSRRTTTTARQTPNDTKSIQNVVTQNLSKLTDVIRPTPYRVGGEQVGFRVYPGRDRRQFAALGLRPGDVIKDIDGQALSDATQAMQIFQSLGTAEQVTVTVERNGESQTLTLKTSQLELSDEQTQ